MKKFCTNCGQPNEPDNRACVECGASLAEEKQEVRNSVPAAPPPPPKKSKKPLTLKTKVLSLLGILVVASLIGVYTWGSKTASADTAVTKFFEALRNEDAQALSKQAMLSNGESMSVDEAAAFILLYRDISPYELEDVAKVEKNGKVIGIFNAHRVTVPVQKLSFDFPHEGLALHLNGELHTSVKYSDGEYVFSEISPGLHDAEFIYDGEFTEFSYPFELDSYMGDPSVINPVYVDLPVSYVTFSLETFNADDADANKVIIVDKEVPVNEFGETDEVGPVLLDGSLTAQAEVKFPWGTQVSEPVEITSYYQAIDYFVLEEEQRKALIDQLKVFSEELVEALGTRDSAVFTTVTDELLAAYQDDIEYMEDYEEFFMGALKEIGVDEESITILSGGETVTVDVELQIDGDNYYSSKTPEAESMEVDAAVEFIFDQKSEKWLVSSYNPGMNYSGRTPTVTFEGSGKMHQKAFASEVAKKEADVETSSEEEIYFPNEVAEAFMSEYNDASVAAINAGDFTLVSSFVDASGPRAKEQSDFIDNLYSKGITEEHLSTKVEKVVRLDGDYYEVTTIEKFIIHGTESSSEKTYRTVTKVLDYPSAYFVYELISTTEI